MGFVGDWMWKLLWMENLVSATEHSLDTPRKFRLVSIIIQNFVNCLILNNFRRFFLFFTLFNSKLFYTNFVNFQVFIENNLPTFLFL